MRTEYEDARYGGDSSGRRLATARRPVGLALATAVCLAAIVFWTTAPVAQRVRSTVGDGDLETGQGPTTTSPTDDPTVIVTLNEVGAVDPNSASGTDAGPSVGSIGGREAAPGTDGDGGQDEAAPAEKSNPTLAPEVDQLPMTTTDGSTSTSVVPAGESSASTTTAPGPSGSPVDVEVQTDITPVPVLDPRDFGARGDGTTDDTDALQRAVDEAGDLGGGIVLIADGVTYRTTDIIVIRDDHVRLWSRSGRGAILADTGGSRTSQAIICQDNEGCGVHGVRFRATATRRLAALEDSQIVLDGATNGEVVGNEIEGSASAAIFIYGRSAGTHIEGNYVHDSWSDSVHFTGGSRRAWVWDNTFYTPTEGKGDDGIACVTYGDGSRCRDMEWWGNTHLGSGWGRAFAVVGGEQIEIHHNYAQNIAGAGVLIASEPSYDTPGSSSISIHSNTLVATGQVVPHAGILVSGLSARITDVDVRNNVVVDSANDEATRVEGDVESVEIRTTSTSADSIPQPVPDPSNASAKSTDTLKIRDRSFVDPAFRPGLHRIHISMSSSGTLQQHYEYVVAGPLALTSSWAAEIGAGDVAVSAGERASVVISPVPATLPAGVREVPFTELRRLDTTGSGPQIWAHLNR